MHLLFGIEPHTGQGTPEATRSPSIRSGQPGKPTKERKAQTLPPARKEFAEEATPRLFWGDFFLSAKRRRVSLWSRGSFFIGYSWTQESKSFCPGFCSSPFVSALWGGAVREHDCFPMQAVRAAHGSRLTLALSLHSERACEDWLGQATLQSNVNKVCLMKCSVSCSGCRIFSKYKCSAHVWF